MDLLFKIVLCTLCLRLYACNAETYMAAIIDTSRENIAADKYASLFYEASKMNADILVLPAPEFPRSENHQDICIVDRYDEIVKSISDAAKTFRLYVVAHLLERIHCQGSQELIRNNLVFDRDGSVVSVYRKPLQGSNCNITSTNSQTFSTDFGVTFGLLMEEDLVVKNPRNIKTEKNFVVIGKSSTNAPSLSVQQFSSSWSYAINANLISSEAIYAGKAGLKTGSGRVIVAKLAKDGGKEQPTINFGGPITLTNFPGEDLSQHTIRPLDIETIMQGYHETVCHNKFCCDFHLKTNLLGNLKEVNYGLVAFNGIQHLDHQQSIGVQSCALVACVGLYKRSCFVSSENTTNIAFDELYISGNFDRNSVQFPIVQSSAETILKSENFVFDAESTDDQNHVTAKIYNIKDVLRFGIFSRDYSKDFKSNTQFENLNKTNAISEVSNYISSENVQEFFDYLWIRIRILIFVVSIYVLEMM